MSKELKPVSPLPWSFEELENGSNRVISSNGKIVYEGMRICFLDDDAKFAVHAANTNHLEVANAHGFRLVVEDDIEIFKQIKEITNDEYLSDFNKLEQIREMVNTL